MPIDAINQAVKHINLTLPVANPKYLGIATAVSHTTRKWSRDEEARGASRH